MPEWERISTEHQADYEIFSVRRDRARSPRDGSAYDFYIAESAGGVTLIALTPRGELVMVEQFRHPLREVTLETPSGIIDDGEDPVDAARRELREETGYQGGEAEHLGTLVLNPSWQTTKVHVVLVTGAERTADKDLDEGEDTRVRLVPRGEVRARVLEGGITSAVAVSALALWEWHGGAP